MTYAPDPKPQFEIPSWVWRIGSVALVFGALQIPRVMKANQAGVNVASDLCQKVENGMPLRSAMQSMEELDSYNYSKNYKFVAMNSFKSNLKNCDAIVKQARINVLD
ncbi:hypothetical protein OAL13_00055 [bacterium]|nr:hypothetical protein [bacterium]